MPQFMLGAQASCTEVETPSLSIYGYCNWMYIGHPAALGMSLRMADIAAELRFLLTNGTFRQCFAPVDLIVELRLKCCN